eukprot:scaffold90257_cov69-Phaeocystis_antarctica.AAC.1
MLAHVSRCARLVELQLGGKALVKTYSKVADRYVNLLNYSQSNESITMRFYAVGCGGLRCPAGCPAVRSAV